MAIPAIPMAVPMAIPHIYDRKIEVKSTGIIPLLHLGIGAMECHLAIENIRAFWRFKGVF